MLHLQNYSAYLLETLYWKVYTFKFIGIIFYITCLSNSLLYESQVNDISEISRLGAVSSPDLGIFII